MNWSLKSKKRPKKPHKSDKNKKPLVPYDLRNKWTLLKKYFQRRIAPHEPEIITLQDIKDVALFLADPKDLSLEFVTYFHLPEVDRLLKAFIIYFHYYLQIWDCMQTRREEAKRKLRQPIVAVLEDVICDNLADLRCMVAREYGVVIMGIGKTKRFHHLSTSTNSLSDKDRRLVETLICMSVKVVWIALQRRHLALIEMELNRLQRSDLFNSIAHRGKTSRVKSRSENEKRVLQGLADRKESKLKQRSGLIKELLLIDHDYRMLGIGFKNFKPSSERIDYLEKIFVMPEEDILNNNITVGLIGIPRDEYDCIMKRKERTSKNFDKKFIEPLSFTFPPNIPVPFQDIPPAFPKEPCHYSESRQSKKARRKQLALWLKFIVKTERVIPLEVDEETLDEEMN